MKFSFQQFAYSIVAIVFLSGCATRPSAVESNRSEDWNGQVRKLYVQVTFMPEWGKDFSDALEDKLGRIFSDCGISARIVRRSTLDLDNRDTLPNELRKFEADSLLTIAPTGGGLNQDNVAINRVFAGRLVILPNRTVWRANFRVYRGGTAVEKLSDRGSAFAIELTNTMKADRLLGSCSQLPVPSPGLR